MNEDHDKAIKIYKRRNALLKRIHKITEGQLQAVNENRIDDYLQSFDERQRYLKELIETEIDVKKFIDDRIGASCAELTSLEASARETFEKICAIEPEIEKRVKLRLREVEGEVGNIRKARTTVKAYHTRTTSKRGREINKQG